MSGLAAYARREVARRPGRALLAAFGVVLGVAAMVASALATSSASAAYRAMYGALGGHAAFEVVAEGLGGFDADVAARVAAVEGVAAAAPVVLSPAALVAPGPRTPVVVLGIDPEHDRAVRTLTIVAGRGLGGEDDGVVLLASVARAAGIDVGTSLRLVTTSGTVTARVVGLAGPDGLAAFPGGVVVTSLATAQRWGALGARVTAVQAVLADGAPLDRVEAAIAAVLPAGLRVQRPAARALLADGSLRSAEQGLAAVSLMSLVAAVFVILNAFAMNLAERRRALATVRAIGATRRQVVRALLVEAAVLGLAGTVVGVAVGIVGARVLAAGIGTMLGVALPPPPVRWGPIAVALVVGPATTLLATAAAARRAARRDPLADLLGAPETVVSPRRRTPVVVGVGCLAFLFASQAGLMSGRLSSAWIAPSIAVGMLGAALLFPTLLPPLRRGVGAALAPFLAAPGRLGLRQVERRPIHTALSSTVLFVAMTGAIGMGNELLANVDDVRDWAANALVEDYFVRATMPEAGTVTAAPVGAALRDELGAIPGVAHVNRIRFIPSSVAGLPVIVIARTWQPGRPPALDVRATATGAPLVALADGEAAVGTALAQRAGLHLGDTFTLATRHGPASLRVVATVTEYTAGGLAVYVDFGVGERAFGVAGADAYMVVAQPARRAAVGQALAAVCARDGLLLQSTADLHADVDGKVAGIVGLLWTALAVVFVVASLGVVNTLAMNVLDQTRAIGVLRAIGATRGQVVRMVLAQAVGISAVAVLPGALAGLAMSKMLNVGSDPVRGFAVPFRIDLGLVGACAAAAVVVACAAALVPAWRAARLPVIAALRRD